MTNQAEAAETVSYVVQVPKSNEGRLLNALGGMDSGMVLTPIGSRRETILGLIEDARKVRQHADDITNDEVEPLWEAAGLMEYLLR